MCYACLNRDMENKDAQPKGNYTALAARTPLHRGIRIQITERAYPGDKIWYRGMELTVLNCWRNA